MTIQEVNTILRAKRPTVKPEAKPTAKPKAKVAKATRLVKLIRSETKL